MCILLPKSAKKYITIQFDVLRNLFAKTRTCKVYFYQHILDVCLFCSGVQKWDRELLGLEGASVGCAGCKKSQPTRPADETYIKPRSRVERLPPSPHVKEPNVTAHYEHYAHDEWSIRDLLHWLNYPSLPITFPCFESRGV